MKKYIPAIVAVVLIVILAAGILGKKVSDKYSYSDEKVDVYEYFNLVTTEEIAIVLQNELMAEKAIRKDGVCYFDLATVHAYFNDRFYVDETEQLLLYTTATEIIRTDIGTNEYAVDGEKKDAGWELEAVGNISLLFGILKKNRFIIQDRNDTGDIIFGRKVMDYLAKNVSAQITSRDAARELYMNQSYFCRLFKKTFGCTFEKYVLIYRLEKARLLLANTALPVTEIAFSLGFCNCSYFGKVFKERFNVTPTSHRRSTTNAN